MLLNGVSVTGQGPLIVFLHSSLSSSKQWQGLANSLSDKFTCVNIDLLGYGNAENVVDTKNYSFDDEVARILKIIDCINKNNTKFHLVGHSCGGAIALKMAVELPERILSLTAFEPVAFHLLSDVTKQHQIEDFAAKISSFDKSLACKSFVDYWNGDGFYDTLPRPVQQAMMINIDKVNLDFIGIFNESYTLANLASLSLPCMIIRGKYTREVSALLSSEIVKAISHSVLVDVATGHMGPVSHPMLVEPVISEFLLSHL